VDVSEPGNRLNLMLKYVLTERYFILFYFKVHRYQKANFYIQEKFTLLVSKKSQTVSLQVYYCKPFFACFYKRDVTLK